MRPSYYLVDSESAVRTVYLCDECFKPDPLEGSRSKVEAPSRRHKGYDAELQNAFPTGGYIITEPKQGGQEHATTGTHAGRVCAHAECSNPIPNRNGPGRPRAYCSNACKLREFRKRHGLWLGLLDDGIRGRVRIPAYDERGRLHWRRMRPRDPAYIRWLASSLLVNQNITADGRKQMAEIANLTTGELRRLQRRVTRIENALADFAFENEAAAKKVRQRLADAMATLEREERARDEEAA